MNNLYQPLEVEFVPSPYKAKALNLTEFLVLLRQEEDFFRGEQYNTQLMITRLRKIFYDAYGWNRELIRGAANIKARYEVKMVPAGESGHLVRKVLVRKNDWMNPNAGTVPEIYTNDNQEITLPNGLYCDIGHVLAGMDCFNYPQVVAPLPTKLLFLKDLVPHGNKNMDVATWLGDLASISGEILYAQIYHHKKLNEFEIQQLVFACAPGQDMLGNIDAYAIARLYILSSSEGKRVSDIFADFYRPDNPMQKYRFHYFCEQVNLKNWNGENFENEQEWLRYNTRELRNTLIFYLATRFPKPSAYFYDLLTYLHHYDKGSFLSTIILNFLIALKKEIKML